MRRGVGSAGVGLIAAAILAACTGGDDPAGTQPVDPSTPVTASTSGTDATAPPPTHGDGTSARTQPLVVISSLRRPRLHLTLPEARALAHGDVGAALDSIRRQAGGRVHLDRDAMDAVSVVARGR